MRSLKTNLNVVGAALVWVLVPVLAALAAPVADKPAESANDKARKALEHTVNVDYDGVTLADILGDLSEKTKVRFVANRTGDNGVTQVQLKERNLSVRELLRRLDLAGVVIDGTVYVADESTAVERQMRQRVSLDLDEVPLAKALQRLAKQTQTNLVLDPRLPKDVREATITLQLDDVPLETAVRLVVEVADDVGHALDVDVDNPVEFARRHLPQGSLGIDEGRVIEEQVGRAGLLEETLGPGTHLAIVGHVHHVEVVRPRESAA